MKHKLYLSAFSCSMILLFLFTGTAMAHKVTVFAWVEGNTIYGDSKFSGGKKAKNAEIIVWDEQGKELLRTKTDDNGEFAFPVPQKTALRIELNAGMGHRADWTIPLEDLEDARVEPVAAGSTPENKQPALDDKKPAPPSLQGEMPATSPKGATTSLNLDQALLESIVEKAVTKALNQKITPLTKMVADLEQKGPSVNDIMGGIGYIFGLMGVAMYFKAKNK